MEEQLRRFSICQELLPEEIHAAYNARVRLVHPDKCLDEDIQLANEAFPKVKLAKEVLQDPVKRADFDRETFAKLREQLLEFQLTSLKLKQEEDAKRNYASADESFL